MTTVDHRSTVSAAAATGTPASQGATRSLLTCAVVASPLWAVVALTQAATRDGFDITRHPLSALSNGSLGWLQIANFLAVGALLALGATGLRRALHGTPGSTWVPRLVRVAGIGMIAAGVFVMDPADGFPVGTPYGMPATLTWHSYAHFAAGSITFISMIAACYVLARHFSRIGNRGYAVLARIGGTALLLGNGWSMSGGKAGTLTLAVGVMTAMFSISLIAGHYRRSH
ncbi:DUF998 domain-containing protein [Streptomyces sp. NBC_01077]|uniref:DUF998 domain-containing protein n=1 Tax=Streptomyces sp. NBC_01077 TaxID=2903746 RepID=UPI00386DF1F9|nr:DUF998 domain-containing protein [Streptomyces sp. NBC_01077]